MNLFVGGHFLKFVKCKSSVGGKNILRIDKSSALVFGTLENVVCMYMFFSQFLRQYSYLDALVRII